MIKDILKRTIISILTIEARLVLRKYKPKIVAVTGSVGKTSAKDAIYSVLSAGFFVRKSEKSFNSEIGIPLTILGCPSGWHNPFIWFKNILEGLALILFKNHYPRWLVLEVGADRPGDIKQIATWLQPDIVVVTRLPDVPVHVEFFDSPQEVHVEKGYLLRALKGDGIVVVNADDEHVLALAKNMRQSSVTYGFASDATIKASNYQITYENKKPTGITFRVNYGGSSTPVTVRSVIGKQYAYPALAAIAVGASQGLHMVAIGDALSKFEPPQGRMKVLEGIKESLIIDDSYNSSPVAVDEALIALKDLKNAGRKIVVLGDMMELGNYSAEAHKRVGEQAATVANMLVTVGIRARHIAQGALTGGMSEKNILQYEEALRAGKELELELQASDVVLVKGSQSMRMEKVVQEIMAHPEQRRKFLVRQEKEWLI